ncbi:hypothetical protein PROFUN_11017 [Planoprotostelium fungivorum]|uniref:Transmembrane protein n=1 Tax=Planoprotostelium fungivorum TaxID=1890364 RepID=A0A2P6NBR3_9EUKA|nr:hypothetical protein PROFUN_11017 [Planoprotostelium fungivorum]
MKFFERQSVDEVGKVSVTLQKVLIALSVFIGLTFVLTFMAGPLAWLLAGVHALLVFIAWRGATQRRERLLKTYYISSILLLVFYVVFTIAVVVVVANQRKLDAEQRHLNVSFGGRGNRDGSNGQEVATISAVAVVGGIVFIIIGAVLSALQVATVVLSIRLAGMIRIVQGQHLAHPLMRKTGFAQLPTISHVYIPMSSTQSHVAVVPQAIIYQPNAHVHV